MTKMGLIILCRKTELEEPKKNDWNKLNSWKHACILWKRCSLLADRNHKKGGQDYEWMGCQKIKNLASKNVNEWNLKVSTLSPRFTTILVTVVNVCPFSQKAEWPDDICTTS